MLRHLLRLLALTVLTLILGTPAALTQQPAPGKPATQPQPAPQPKPAPSDEEKGERSFALPYVFLILYTLLVLTIVCMPSRKA